MIEFVRSFRAQRPPNFATLFKNNDMTQEDFYSGAMDEEGAYMANMAQLITSKLYFIVPASSYSPRHDSRMLIPFVEYMPGGMRYGFVNREGDIVVPAKYDFIKGDCFSEDDQIIVGTRYMVDYGTKNSPNQHTYHMLGTIDYTGKVVIPLRYSVLMLSESKNIYNADIGVAGDRKRCLIDKLGNEVVPAGKYDWIDTFVEGYARVIKYVRIGEESVRRWGIIHESGIEVFPLSPNRICPFRKGDEYFFVNQLDGFCKRYNLADLKNKIYAVNEDCSLPF